MMNNYTFTSSFRTRNLESHLQDRIVFTRLSLQSKADLLALLYFRNQGDSRMRQQTAETLYTQCQNLGFTRLPRDYDKMQRILKIMEQREIIVP